MPNKPRIRPTMPTISMKADSQRGVALLTILLLVVSITVVAGNACQPKDCYSA